MEEQVIDRRQKKKEKDSGHRIRPRQTEGNNISNENMQARWLDDIDELHNTKAKMRKVKNNTIQGIGNH